MGGTVSDRAAAWPDRPPLKVTPELTCSFDRRSCLSLETLVAGWIGQVTFTVLHMHGGQHGALERYELRTRYRTGVERATTPQPTADA